MYNYLVYCFIAVKCYIKVVPGIKPRKSNWRTVGLAELSMKKRRFMMERKKLIEFRNITKSFDKQITLKGINLDIFENEFDDLTNITIKSIPQPILEIYKSLMKNEE
jgi:hypothetical protein